MVVGWNRTLAAPKIGGGAEASGTPWINAIQATH
jgi:hypothetical protein